MGGIVINTKKPIEVFDKVEEREVSNMSGNAQPFEKDEKKKVVEDKDSQAAKDEKNVDEPTEEIHDDDDLSLIHI